MLRSDGAGLVVVVLGARVLGDRLPVRMMGVEPRPHGLLAAAVRAHREELAVVLKTILRPSGDHAGVKPPAVVSRVGGEPPSRRIT